MVASRISLMGFVTELLFKRSMENHEKEIARDSSSRMCPDIGATPDIGPDIGKGGPKAGRCPISDIGPDTQTLKQIM